MKKRKILFFLIILLSFQACYYTFKGTQSYGLSKIFVMQMNDGIGKFGLSDLYTGQIIDYVEKYTSLDVVSKNYDAYLEGELTAYKNNNEYIINVPKEDDEIESTEKYEITLTAKIKLVKLPTLESSENKVLWEGTINESLIYSIDAGKSAEDMESEKQQELVQLLAEKSVIKIFEGW